MGALAVIVAVTAPSQFYRSSLGVIAPELSRDLEMSPEQLGWANGAFFLAMALAQIPVGLLFDRYGPRLSVAASTAIAFVAAIWQAMAASAEELIAARFLLGLGCAATAILFYLLVRDRSPELALDLKPEPIAEVLRGRVSV